MDSKIHYKVFDYDLKDEVTLTSVYPVSEEMQEIAREMVLGKFAQGNAIYIYKFLKDDLSLNLEKLEIAIILTVRWLEANTSFDDELSMFIVGIQEYYDRRGINDMPSQKKEEYYFIRGFMQAVAENESVKPIKVQYATD